MGIPVIMKVALDAVKARALAEKAGIIAHPQSNWKWALRQIRAKNPTGAYQAADDLILKGKDLAKAKEKIGLLPNNVRQKVKALSRKQRLGVEVGAAGDSPANMKYVSGEVGRVRLPMKDTRTNTRYSHDIHTHPAPPIVTRRPEAYNKARNPGRQSITPQFYNEINRANDPVMAASPSGTPWGVQQNMAHSQKIDKTIAARSPAFNAAAEPIRTKANGLIGKLDKNMPSEAFGGKIERINKARNSMYANIGVPSPKTVKVDARFNTPASPGGDFGNLLHAPKPVGIPSSSNIMSQHTTSVNKARPKLPNMTRSVYFKGGLS